MPSKDFASNRFIDGDSYCTLVLSEREESSVQYFPDKSWTKAESYLHFIKMTINYSNTDLSVMKSQ